MFKQFFDQFLPKAIEYVAEQGLNNVRNIKDFEHNLETLQKNLKLLSAKAYDVEDEIKNGERSGRKKRKREVEEWLEDVRSIETEVDGLGSQVESEGSVIMRLMDGGGKAAQLNLQVEKLVQQRLDFGEPVLDAFGTAEEILLTNGMVGEAFNQNRETVLKLLENRQDSMIGVYGMGGIGKTTLAKQIYNRLVQQSQGRVFWITVSQEFTVRSLQDKIARCLGVGLSDEDEEATRAGRLNRFLSQMKNSVLILDDVWERIDMLKVGCTFSAEGCRLIITTRSLEVCRRIGCKKLILVVKLCKEEAWMLFNKTLENEAELSPQVEEIAKSMTALCGGLPLGIITVAGSMKGETAIHTWRNALAELKECVRGKDETGEVEEVFKVLKYSFDRLKRNHGNESNGFNVIQKCFLHCSLYPEDFEIGRDDLVRSFISEGLVDGRWSRRAQFEQGHSILDKLVNLCLLESCVNYENLTNVKMHDLVRSMALRICKGIYMVRAGERSLKEIPNQEEWTKDLEKVSFMKCGIFRIGEEISPDCPKLSTLLLSENNWLSLKVIPESFFSKMQGLCTLDMGGNWQIAMLPDSITDLTCLKSLLLEGCYKLEKVPYLGKMKALRELNLSGTAIKEAPQGLEELLNLRFLSMNADGLEMLPKGVLKLGHLEHLNIPLHIQVEIEEINNLKRLEEFGGGVKSVSDFNWFVRSRAHDVTCCRIGVLKNVLETAKFERGWPKAPNNNELELHKCDLKDEKVLGKGIMDLTISKCEGVSKWLVDDLRERFDNPTSLKILTIQKCRGIEWIMRRSDGEASQLSTTLEKIDLNGLEDLKGVVEVMEREKGGIGAAAQPPVFSSLKMLEISKCNQMRKLGLPASGVPNLEVIVISMCEEVEEIFQKEEDEGRDSATTLPKLRVLELQHLPRLKRGLCTLDLSWSSQIAMLPDSISDLTCLKSLHLENCQKLEKVPYLGKLKALRELNLSGTAIKEAPQGLEELCHLKFLSMTVDGLKMLPKGLLLKLRHLEHLKLPLHIQVEIEEINNLKQLEQFIGVNLESGYGSPFGNETDVGGKANELVLWESNLKEEKVLGKGIVFLTIRDSKGLSKWLVDGLSERFDNPSSLRKLQVSRCGGIEWILRSDGQASQITNTLEVMELHRLDDLKGVVVMQRPAQLLVFSSLKNLVIYRCGKMRKLGFPVSAVPNLEKILIKLCIEMQEIFEDEEEGRRASGSILPRLKELRLNDLPGLKSVSKATIISNFIQTIFIKECPELMKKLPLHFDDPTPPPSLREVTVKREWWESLEWEFNPNLPRLLQPFLQFLL